jgi:hypothetical protein
MDSDDPAQAKRARKMLSCSCSGQYVVPPDRTPYLRLDRCSKRLCPLCSRVRAGRVRRTLKQWFKGRDNMRHVVLTVPHSKGALRDQITSLLNTFRGFRRTPAFKRHVQGGMYCLEVSRKPKADSWHVHLHVVVTGLYWGQRELARDWSEVVGQDAIVWISRAGDRHASYLAKYIGAPDKLHLLDPGLIREYEYGIHGRRMIQSFGDWHGAVEDGDKTLPLPSDSLMINLDILLRMRDRGHRGATRICDVLSLRYPVLRPSKWKPPPIPHGDNNDKAQDIDDELRRTAMYARECMQDYSVIKLRPRRNSTGEDTGLQ